MAYARRLIGVRAALVVAASALAAQVTLAVVGVAGGAVAATGLAGKPSTAAAGVTLRIGSPGGVNLGRP